MYLYKPRPWTHGSLAILLESTFRVSAVALSLSTVKHGFFLFAYLLEQMKKTKKQLENCACLGLVGRSPTVPDGRSGCKPIWDLFCALCSTAMNIIILKWVLTDLRRVNHKDGTAILHAVLQLDASGSVTKPRDKCCNLIGRHYSGARTNSR